MKQSVVALLIAGAIVTPTLAFAVAVSETRDSSNNVGRDEERALYFVAGSGRALRFPFGFGLSPEGLTCNAPILLGYRQRTCAVSIPVCRLLRPGES
jgi:hypothetical protein